ncbi:MAG: HPr family phosphocarrier protein [Verrucomicrobia bacterium]|nr:HPr family phosphocarrier protein [Verrucomicrobiota bacterium]
MATQDKLPNSLRAEVKVVSPMGLHARPAASLVRLLQGTRSKVVLNYKDYSANGRSVVEILMLAAKKDAKIEVLVDGEDAANVLEMIVSAFKRGLDAP